MISAFANTLKIPELRQRIYFTLAMMVIVRLGAHISIPGVDTTVLQQWVDDFMTQDSGEDRGAAAIGALFNVFSGGGLQNCAIFALGIMPYISASIMMQLLSAVVPQLGKLSREDGGRQKISQYTRILTLVLCVFQSYMLAQSLKNPQSNIFLANLASAMDKTGPLVPDHNIMFVMTAVITITAGTMLLMWIGDQITERGIGNGVSLIITVNIIFSLPGAIFQVWNTYIDPAAENPLKPLILVGLIALMLLVIAAVIAITQAQRRITIQYARRMVGRKVYGGQKQYLPLKVNYAGVMPIIFAQAILLFPAQILSMAFPGAQWVNNFSEAMNYGWPYYIISGLLIFFFSYFWVATMFQPQQIASDLQKNGGYVPGVRPGKPTAEFLDFTMSRLTFAGAIFLTIVAVLPSLLTKWANVPPLAAQFFGGTSILILVGVLLDMMRQIETHLIQQHYDGFLRKGKIRGRGPTRGLASGSGSGAPGMIWLLLLFMIFAIVGMSYYIYTQYNG